MTDRDRSIALYWQHKPGANKDKELVEAAAWALELKRFYKQYARKQWDVEVKHFLWEGTEVPTPPSYSASNIAQTVDLGGYNPKYHHVVSYHSNPGYCGLGNMPGTRSVTYLYGTSCSEHTCIHEVGHNFGLNHANDHDDGEYRDSTCVMGVGPYIPGLNSPHILELGLETDRERINVSQSKQLLICPIELPPHAMHDDEWQHVVVEKAGHPSYYLSLRKDKGWPWMPNQHAEHILFIHYRKDGKSVLLDTMGLSSAPKVLPNGVELSYHEYKDETARVSIDFKDGVPIKPVLMPLGFPEVLSGSELGPQHYGLWYNPDFDGQGFDLHVRGGRMAVYWYTYNNEKTNRRWYWGTAHLGQGSEEFTIWTTDGGTFNDASTAKVTAVGKGQLYFFSENEGVFNYNTTEHGRGSVDIQRLAKSTSTISGLWYDDSPTREMSGFGAQFVSDDRAIFYWYTYGAKTSSTPKQIETQRWFMLDLSKTSGTTYSGKVYEMQGGKFGTYTPPKVVEVGTAQLTIQGSGLVLLYDMVDTGDPSTTGRGTYNLKRLL